MKKVDGEVYTVMRAALLGAERVRKLLEKYPRLTDARTPRMRETALHHLAIENAYAAVAALLDAGVEVDPLDASGATPLSHAATLGHADLVRLLLARGADPHLRDHIGDPPLLRAARSGATEVVRILLEAGADPSALDELRREGDGAVAQPDPGDD